VVTAPNHWGLLRFRVLRLLASLPGQWPGTGCPYCLLYDCWNEVDPLQQWLSVPRFYSVRSGCLQSPFDSKWKSSLYGRQSVGESVLVTTHLGSKTTSVLQSVCYGFGKPSVARGRNLWFTITAGPSQIIPFNYFYSQIHWKYCQLTVISSACVSSVGITHNNYSCVIGMAVMWC
jgi:hypothetical protein